MTHIVWLLTLYAVHTDAVVERDPTSYSTARLCQVEAEHRAGVDSGVYGWCREEVRRPDHSRTPTTRSGALFAEGWALALDAPAAAPLASPREGDLPG